MSSRLVPSLQEILYRLVGAATEEVAKEPTTDKPGRFPVVVRPETRAFLETQASYLGGSIAGVAGAILDGVAMTTQGRDGGVMAFRGVAERFSLLIQEHRLSIPAAVEALADLGFTLADFTSIEALQLKLSSSALRNIAQRFHVSYDWLAGKSDLVLDGSTSCWYKQATVAAEKILNAKQQYSSVQLIILKPKNADLKQIQDDGDWSKLPHFLPILSYTTHLSGGEELRIYEVWEEGRWSYWRCRDYLKLAVYFAVRAGVNVIGRSLMDVDYDRLQSGRILATTVLNGSPSLGLWHPDDYVLPGSPVAKDSEEWFGIQKNYGSTFEAFEGFLQLRGESA